MGEKVWLISYNLTVVWFMAKSFLLRVLQAWALYCMCHYLFSYKQNIGYISFNENGYNCGYIYIAVIDIITNQDHYHDVARGLSQGIKSSEEIL